MSCKNCQCKECEAEHVVKCNGECEKSFKTKELNEYGRCKPCERKHANWRKTIKHGQHRESR